MTIAQVFFAEEEFRNQEPGSRRIPVVLVDEMEVVKLCRNEVQASPFMGANRQDFLMIKTPSLYSSSSQQFCILTPDSFPAAVAQSDRIPWRKEFLKKVLPVMFRGADMT